MSRVRVLVVSEPMEYGVLAYLERVCEGLDPARFALALAVSPRRMAPQGRHLLARLAARGVPVRRLPFHRGLGVGDVPAAAGLLEEVRAFGPDLVHAHSTKAGIAARLVAGPLGVPVLYTPHGTSWHYTGRLVGAAQLAVERALRRLTHAVVAVCREEARAFVREVGHRPERVLVVPNGVAVPEAPRLAATRARARRALGLRDGDVWVLFVGRLTREKGADLLLDAVEAGTGADGVVVVGDGGERPVLEARARRAGVTVRFAGYQADVTPFLAAADVFVQPSRSEGLPFTALEAMAHGLPVVSTAVGGLGSAVGDAGLVVAPEDGRGLGEALRALARDAERRHRLGEAGRRRVARRFDVAAMLGALERIYEEAARGGRASWPLPARTVG
jgi:glycosyltransferase involved in cell wall biosynthesis